MLSCYSELIEGSSAVSDDSGNSIAIAKRLLHLVQCEGAIKVGLICLFFQG